MIKNLLLIFVLAIALLAISFLFNRIQHIGYKTRMLYTTMIFLPVPAFVGFFMGFFIIGSSIFSTPYDDAIRITVQILLVYLVLCLIASFIEFLVVITAQMQDLERKAPRRRNKKVSRIQKGERTTS
ncbi:MAG: hypothetical protein FK733_04040 [Asgard group archaeon]|nr:hypothetical protein [Asgard group archaeon]